MVEMKVGAEYKSFFDKAWKIISIDQKDNVVTVLRTDDDRAYMVHPFENFEWLLMNEKEREQYEDVFDDKLMDNERSAMFKLWHCLMGRTSSSIAEFVNGNIIGISTPDGNFLAAEDENGKMYAVNVEECREVTVSEYETVKDCWNAI
jgi:hypothetical protein